MSFESELAAEMEVIKAKAAAGVKEIASQVFSNLVSNSPIPGVAEYALGSYILSHRISEGTIDTDITELVYKDEQAPMEAVENEVPKLSGMAPFAQIHISNSIDYNEEIESLGWDKTGPYHTFSKTEGTMETVAQQILATI